MPAFTPKDWEDGPGLVLLDSNGHYWRLDVSTGGVISTTDLGTSAPSDTPLDAVGLEDMETRLADFAGLLRFLPAGVPLVTEDFGSIADFTTLTGTGFAASSGLLTYTSSGGDSAIVRTSEHAVDVLLIAKVNVGSNRNFPFGFVVRGIDANNFILIATTGDSSSPFTKVEIYKKVSGSYTQLSQAASNFPFGTAYRTDEGQDAYIVGIAKGRAFYGAIYAMHPDLGLMPAAWTNFTLSPADYATFDDPDDFGLRAGAVATNATIDDFVAYSLD